MFNKKTTIVVGAGASSEVDLPTGNMLKSNISEILDFRFEHGYRRISGDDLVYEALRQNLNIQNRNPNDINEYLLACRNIKEALPQTISIDNFIDSHQGNNELELCGKLAIVRAILKSERDSSLYINRVNGESTLNFKAIEDKWLNTFMKLLTENCKIDQVHERLKNIQFVIFNYDRCIEHFLYHSLQNYYQISNIQAAELIKDIKIYHPYGVVGNLPWYGNDNLIDYGSEPSASLILQLAKDIKTFTEGTDPSSSNIISLRESVSESNILIFLGFAYHQQNIKLIAPENKSSSNVAKKSFGTALGISESDRTIIVDEISMLFDIDRSVIKIRNDLSAYQLFNEYWRSLSLS